MKENIKTLIKPLFDEYGAEILPASSIQVESFRSTALRRGVPISAIGQLVKFYQITNGIPCLDGFDFHRCEDEILYEWWDELELWLGAKDDDVLRWVDNKFCIGDTANLSYGKEYEFDSLVELIENSMKEWFCDNY
ncbi:hypothetical protein [Desulforhopalus sp. 52FAK]